MEDGRWKMEDEVGINEETSREIERMEYDVGQHLRLNDTTRKGEKQRK